MWTIAKVKNGFADLSNSRFHTFAILKDGEVVGELKFDHSRWKSAGGPAWKGMLHKPELHGNKSGPYGNASVVCYYNKDRKNVLNWFKTGELSERGEL